jgi:hypothetical protein
MIKHFTSISQSDSKLIDSFQWDILKAFQAAYNSKKREPIMEILQFANGLILKAINQNAIEVLQQLYFLPSYFLRICKSDRELSSLVAEYQGVSFKTKWIVVKYHFEKKGTLDQLQITLIERFYLAVASFYHELIESNENESIRKAFNEFNQMSGRFESEYFGKRYQFSREAVDDILSQELLKDFKEKAKSKHFIIQTHRRTALCLKAWIIFLYSMDKISFERLNSLDSLVRLKYDFFEDIVDDLNYILDKGHSGFLGVNNWDYTERDTGTTFFGISVRDWIMHGVLNYLLKNQSLRFDTKMITLGQDTALLLSEVEKIILEYKNKIKKWERFFGLPDDRVESDSLAFLDERFRPILKYFFELKALSASFEASLIAKQPLDAELVNSFKVEISDAWKKQCHSFELFDLYQNLIRTDETTKLIHFGERIFLKKSKMMFVKRNQQHIYGLADIGGHIGRRTDATFLETILLNKPTLEYTSATEAINAGLRELINNGYKPNFILVPPEFSYETDLTASQDFTAYWQLNEDERDNKIMGAFKGIPVYNLYSSDLKNQIICAQFEKAFSLEIYESQNLLFNRLHVEIKELSEVELEQKYNENQDEWLVDEKGQRISPEQAKSAIAASVFLEIWSLGKFLTTDNNAYVTSTISNLDA